MKNAKTDQTCCAEDNWYHEAIVLPILTPDNEGSGERCLARGRG